MHLNINKISILNLFAAFLLGVILFLAGCLGTSAGGGSEIGNPGLETFASWNELETHIKTEFSESAIPSSVSPASYTDGENIPTAISDFSLSAFGETYSGTNVQELMVDESDKVKTDGEYIYVSSNKEIHIVSAVPADSMSILGTIDVNGSVDSIYLYNNTLVILYQPDIEITYLDWTDQDLGFFWGMGMPYWIPVQCQTGVLIMDVSDPLSPERVKEWTIDGWMVSSRLTNGKLHIIQQFLPVLPPLQLTYDSTNEIRDDIIAENEQVMDSVNLEDLIPYYEIIDEEGSPGNSAPLITPDNFYHPDYSGGGSIISIVSIDLDNTPDEFHSIGMVADASTVYASTEAIYITSSKWNYGIYDARDVDYYRTYLYKFSLDNETVTLEGTGVTKGRILNQFSLGEYNDVLRIATSTGGWGSNLKSNIYCLEVIDGKLEIIGSLEGLAPGEDIYAARFIGTRGFLVTFVKVDPLFTIDLSDPTNPAVAGELEVPGYSDYIHPLGDNHLLTIGKDTRVEGNMVWYQGLQLSIFDVSDFSDPQLLYTELIGDRGTTSEALDDHKAFTFWAEKNLLAIPVHLYEHQTEPVYPYSYGENTFTGLYVYRININGGFEYLGRIDTDWNNTQSYYGDYWTRGIFINDDVYAVNIEAVRSAPIEDIEGSVSELLLPVNDE